jgi:2-C-methyl-D-erythritol 4-phosphate cytidylyltransferase
MSEPAPRLWAVVPAAGIGRRVGGEIPKQYARLGARSVIEHALAPLLASPRLHGVVVSLAENDRWWGDLALDFPVPPVLAPGGAERCHSVLNALHVLAARAAGSDWVLVHDAARPCLSGEDLERLIDAVLGHPVGGLLALPLGDTLKRVDASGRVTGTVSREGLWRALTPQMFPYARLRRALERAIAAGVLVTDECQAIERFGDLGPGQGPLVVPGRASNLKVTVPEDLEAARRHLEAAERGGGR